MLDAALKEKVLRSVRSHRSPTRAQARPVVALVLGLAAALSLSAFLAVGGPFEARGAAAAGGTALIAALASAAAWGRGRSMLARPAWIYRASLLLTPYALAIWRAVVLARFGVEATAAPPAEALARAVTCGGLTLLLGLPPLLALAWLRRDSEPTRAGPVGAAAGVAIGALVSVLIDLRCAGGAPDHLLGGHALPVLLLGLAGELLGRRVMAVRAILPAPTTPPPPPPTTLIVRAPPSATAGSPAGGPRPAS